MSNNFGTINGTSKPQEDASKLLSTSFDSSNNPKKGVTEGTIFFSKENPSNFDVIRFFQVTKTLENKVSLRELHQLKSTNENTSSCTPLPNLFISTEEITLELLRDSIYQDGKKFAQQLNYQELDINLPHKIKIYDHISYKY